MIVFGRFVVARNLVWGYRRDREIPSIVASPLVASVGCGTILTNLQQDGIHQGFALKPGTIAEIQEFSRTRPCYGDGDPDCELLFGKPQDAEQPGGHNFIIGDYRNEIAHCPAIVQLWSDPVLVEISRQYLNAEPLVVRSRLWWSFRSVGKPDETIRSFAQDSFHFDIDDWLCLKFFFYLSDVGPDDGPHNYVRESHRRRPITHQFSPFKTRTRQEILKQYGEKRIETLQGPAGFGFAEDPYGYHTGTRVTTGPRLLLEIEYGRAVRPILFPYTSKAGNPNQ